MITLDKNYDFCNSKNIYMDGVQIGDVLKYTDGTFEIRVSKRNGKTTRYTTIITNNEQKIITLITNFICEHQ